MDFVIALKKCFWNSTAPFELLKVKQQASCIKTMQQNYANLFICCPLWLKRKTWLRSKELWCPWEAWLSQKTMGSTEVTKTGFTGEEDIAVWNYSAVCYPVWSCEWPSLCVSAMSTPITLFVRQEVSRQSARVFWGAVAPGPESDWPADGQ